MVAALDRAWASPAGTHAEGRFASDVASAARASVAKSLGCQPEGIYFTSGVGSALERAVTGLGERPWALAATERLAALSTTAERHTIFGVDSQGALDLEGFRAAAQPNLGIVVQSANPELGTPQPVESLLAMTRAHGGVLVVDHSLFMPWATPPADWDVLVLEANSWGGPPGVGVLAARASANYRSPDPEGVDSSPPVALQAAAAAALEDCLARSPQTARQEWGSRLLDGAAAELAALPNVEVYRAPGAWAPVLTLSCLYVSGMQVVQELDRRGIAVGSGSACVASAFEPSHVLAAIGGFTGGNVRVSLGLDEREATESVQALLRALPEVLAELREDEWNKPS